jgi:hypothetical protein
LDLKRSKQNDQSHQAAVFRREPASVAKRSCLDLERSKQNDQSHQAALFRREPTGDATQASGFSKVFRKRFEECLKVFLLLRNALLKGFDGFASLT